MGEERSLSFLVPLLAIKADMGRQLEGESAQPEAFLAWVMKGVPEEDRKEAGFIASLVGAIVKHISDATTLAGEGSQDEEVVDKEKEMILAFKEVLQPFLTSLYEADIVEEQVFLKWKEDV